MRIVIDARWIFAEISGIGHYTSELIRQIAEIDHRNEYILLFQEPALLERTASETGFQSAPNIDAHRFACGLFSLHNQFALPALLTRLEADLYHAPNYMIPLRAFPAAHKTGPRCVVTIHDVIPLKLPEFTPRSKKRRLFPIYRRIMREVGRRADAILTVSESSRRDAVEHLGIPAERAGIVHVVYNGVSEAFRPPTQPREDGTRTVLYVGRLDPYKNVTNLVEAFAETRAAGPQNLRLRVIGPPDDRYPEPRQRAEALGISDHIEWSGYVNADALRAAYQDAEVLVLPSRYEGFGLPVLEAMASGTPVICSNAGALPEVAGDAALLVDPDDRPGLVAALQRVITDRDEAQRLREEGIRRAATFPWRRTAEQTIRIYESL